VSLIVLVCTPASSQTVDVDSINSSGLTNVGFAVFNLTAPKFNCDGYLEASRGLKSLHVAFLYNTFGNNFSCLKRVLADPRLESIEIALINEPGHRNKRLGSYEFLFSEGSVSNWNKKIGRKDARLKKKLAKYVVPLQNVLNENLRPETQLFINPGLESNLSDTSGRVLVAWTRELFPNARIVWNPLSARPARRRATRADVLEGHGLNPNLNAPCIYNMDGTDVSYPNRPALGESNHQEGQSKNWVQSGAPLRQLIEEYANRCEVAYVWTQESNGLSYKRGFIDPRKRNHNFSKSTYDRLLSDVKQLQRTGKIYPTSFEYSAADDAIVSSCDVVSKNFVDGYKRGNLLKQSEFRDRGGVIILPSENRTVSTARLYQGTTVIDTYRNIGSYKDGRVLFRSSVSPQNYPFKTYLVFDRSNKKICYQLPNPRVRLD
jgi:hypothetical protein